MKKTLQIVFLALVIVGFARSVSAGPISIFSAPHAYANGGVNPCVFTGNGNDGCGQVDFAFAAPVISTQQFDTTNPLVNTYGDAPGEILQFAAHIGRDFILGLDVNQGGADQTLTNLTITFFGATNNVLGTGYQLGGTPLTIQTTDQGEGFTDYVLSAGCGAPGAVGTGVTATCANYTPFTAPVGTRSITFTYGMGTFNDGAERLFLIAAGPGGSITPFDIEPTAAPEPASLVMLGTGLLGAARYARRKTVKK